MHGEHEPITSAFRMSSTTECSAESINCCAERSRHRPGVRKFAELGKLFDIIAAFVVCRILLGESAIFFFLAKFTPPLFALIVVLPPGGAPGDMFAFYKKEDLPLLFLPAMTLPAYAGDTYYLIQMTVNQETWMVDGAVVADEVGAVASQLEAKRFGSGELKSIAKNSGSIQGRLLSGLGTSKSAAWRMGFTSKKIWY